MAGPFKPAFRAATIDNGGRLAREASRLLRRVHSPELGVSCYWFTDARNVPVLFFPNIYWLLHGFRVDADSFHRP